MQEVSAPPRPLINTNMTTYTKPSKLFGTANAKTIKGEKLGFTTFIIYLSPHKANSMGKNLCAGASRGCIASCLYTSGRAGIFESIPKARLNKTEYFLANREGFMAQAYKEIAAGYKAHGKAMCVRMNGTSDIPWENILHEGKSLMAHFPDVQFYDYTKVFNRLLNELPENYHLTFSVSEDAFNQINAMTALHMGFNIAMVFDTKRNQPLPETYKGFKVVDGDEHDLTFIREKGTIIGLRAKGDARKDTSGFVFKAE